MQILGYKISSGTYQGHDYNNYILTVKDDSEGVGTCCVNLKVKSKIISDFIQSELKGNSNAIIGANINYFFNQYGQISKLILIKD